MSALYVLGGFLVGAGMVAKVLTPGGYEAAVIFGFLTIVVAACVQISKEWEK